MNPELLTSRTFESPPYLLQSLYVDNWPATETLCELPKETSVLDKPLEGLAGQLSPKQGLEVQVGQDLLKDIKVQLGQDE